ncbi:MAG: acyltransferase [Pseudomonadales bacterium]|nr:acyltransferase [Pseudomonadales bacterium]
MLGLIRFILALAVLLSHVPGFAWPLNPGVTAVICFYYISGYLMRRSFARFERFSARPARSFLMDRLFKLFPQYLVVLALTTLLLWRWGPSPGFWVMQQHLSALKVLLNILLLPANYIFGPFVIPALLPHPLIPPAWSLATEFHFYLLLPLIYRWWRILLILLIATFAVQLTGFLHDSPQFNSDSLSYRYIFGVLPIFLMGYLYADGQRAGRYLAGTLWFIYLALAGCALAGIAITQPRAHEVLLGASIAPLLLLIAQSNRLRSNNQLRKWDERLGNLAYPIFISHCLAFYVVEHVTAMPVTASAQFVPCAIFTCLLISVMLDALQRRVERLRISFRGFDSMKNTGSDDCAPTARRS